MANRRFNDLCGGDLDMSSTNSSLNEFRSGLIVFLGFILIIIGLMLIFFSLSPSVSGIVIVFPFFAVKSNSAFLLILPFVFFALIPILLFFWVIEHESKDLNPDS